MSFPVIWHMILTNSNSENRHNRMFLKGILINGNTESRSIGDPAAFTMVFPGSNPKKMQPM